MQYRLLSTANQLTTGVTHFPNEILKNNWFLLSDRFKNSMPIADNFLSNYFIIHLYSKGFIRTFASQN